MASGGFRPYLAAVLMAVASLITACGGTEVDQKNILVPDTEDGAPEKPLPNIELEQLTEWTEIRSQAGDTFAKPPAVMERAILPQISGYKLEINEAETFETKRFTFSEATKVFYNEAGDYIEIIAGDYVDNPEFFEVALQRYNNAKGQQIEGLTDRKLEIDCGGDQPCFAWESHTPARNLAQVNIVMDFRYFISISSTGRDAFISEDDFSSWIDLPALNREE